jgi:hypothetical protein
MISGMIRLSIGASPFVVVAEPRDKIANAIIDGCLSREADVVHQVTDIPSCFHYAPRLHRQHLIGCRTTNSFRSAATWLIFRSVIADVVSSRRRAPVHIILGDAIDKMRYDTRHTFDISEVPGHLAIVKSLIGLSSVVALANRKIAMSGASQAHNRKKA